MDEQTSMQIKETEHQEFPIWITRTEEITVEANRRKLCFKQQQNHKNPSRSPGWSSPRETQS